jgi:hypothetical protein
MRNKVFGFILVLHGMAHTLAGMRVTDPSRWDAAAAAGILLGVGTLAWAAAVVGFVGAGLGLLGAAAFRRRWRGLALAGVVGSVVLLAGLWRDALALPGLAVDLAVMVVALGAGRRAPQARPPGAPASAPAHRVQEVTP